MTACSNIEIITFGCRLNTSESEMMGRLAREADLKNTVIVNTCAVTMEATRQARQAIRRARRDRPDAKIIVTGCAAQIDPERFANMTEVDVVLGNNEKLRASSYSRSLASSPPRVHVNDIMKVTEAPYHQIESFPGRTRATVQIQNGCGHRCTFCVIPYGRGNSRSVPVDTVLEQVRRFVDNGIHEVVLTGVDLTAYGRDLPGRVTLGGIMAKILHHVPTLRRLRLSSIDFIEVDDELFRLIAENDRVMPHLHLSLQSGDNLILKRMKRRHTREEAVHFCLRVREARPEVTFGADLIVGFPTETETMFRNTCGLVDQCGLTWLHVFPFSPRPGTPAARMPQLSGKIIKDRARRLRNKGASNVQAHLAHYGRRQGELLLETDRRGKLADFTTLRLDEPCGGEPGTLLQVYVTGYAFNELTGVPAA